ncbi:MULTISPECIES: hypothetical protein [unclassified Isoptericola]|uniref:hypothetical protein n=1 Tax=unclassified Isoptericola TaxID=2623355 RepID=UPI003659FF70
MTATVPEGTPWWAWLLLMLVVLALVPILLALINARRASHGVNNSHDVNLRDDLDEKHEAVLAAVGELRDDLKRHDSEIRGLRRDIGRDRDDTRAVAERLDGHTAESRREHETLVSRIERIADRL